MTRIALLLIAATAVGVTVPAKTAAPAPAATPAQAKVQGGRYQVLAPETPANVEQAPDLRWFDAFGAYDRSKGELISATRPQPGC